MTEQKCSCGNVGCLCPVCHTACGVDHSPTLPPGRFPIADLCNRHCPEESWLPALVGLPGMNGASMALPIAYLKQWSTRLYEWGGPPNPDMRRTFYHPPQAGEINPMFAAGEWKKTPPDPIRATTGIDLKRLSPTAQATVAQQVDEMRATAAPPPRRPGAKVGRLTRFNPDNHSVNEVIAHLRSSSRSEVERVLALEESGSKRAGILKRRAKLLDESSQ
ncbi:DUF2744 domain-containing protein [Nocardia rhamnosiphila]|uniref:phage gene 29 protein family protein n=1 Tax=Nocardia rhamnosiphila TaxID=426716 RepID=UPI0033DFA386